MDINTVLTVLGSIIVGALAAYGVMRAARIEIEKSRPETITHNCTLSNGLKVYSYFTGRKEHIGPSCVFLDKSDFVTCNFQPTDVDARAKDWENALSLKELNRGKCYLALFADNSEILKNRLPWYKRPFFHR